MWVFLLDIIFNQDEFKKNNLNPENQKNEKVISLQHFNRSNFIQLP